ncbi:TldD/PmbA family protein [Candidatus Woesearchaeota archaeon]|nr:TldD/PmbA family protein [Candidatus Woesearchaeota archaeon]
MKDETKGLCNYTLKELKKNGAEDVIISLETCTTSQIKFSNSRIVSMFQWDLKNAGIFASFSKRLVSTVLKEVSKKHIDETISKINKFINFCKENNDYNGIAKGPFRYRRIKKTHDEKIENLEDEGIDIVKQSIDIAKRKGIEKTAGLFETSSHKTFLLTSNDVEALDTGTEAQFSFRALKTKDSSGHFTSSARMLNNVDFESVCEEACEIANKSLNPGDGKQGKYDVLFHPMAFANLLDSFGNAASAFHVESGMSCLKDKIGKKVASSNVCIYDYGNLKNSPGTATFDAEGVPTRKTTMVKDGILKGYLHNTSTAKRFKTKTTANAGLIAPQPTTIAISEGKFDKEGLIGRIKKGIYVTNIWYTRFNNYTTGDFSTIPRDGIFLIENGKIKKPIKNIRISDNLLRMMQNISGTGNDSRIIQNWETEVPVLCPHVFVTGVNITKSI